MLMVSSVTFLSELQFTVAFVLHFVQETISGITGVTLKNALDSRANRVMYY